MKKKSEGGGGASSNFEITEYVDHFETRVKVALLEQSIMHINQTLMRIEKSLEQRMYRIEVNIERVDRKVDSRFLWLISFCFAGFTGLTGVMAHGFHWF